MKEAFKELSKYLPSQLVSVITIAAVFIGIGGKINGARQAILAEIERNRTVLERLEENQQQIRIINDKQDVIILYVSELSEIQEKTTSEIVKMIKEAAKTPANMPLIERIGEDIKELNHLTPALSKGEGVRGDSVKIGIRRLP